MPNTNKYMSVNYDKTRLKMCSGFRFVFSTQPLSHLNACRVSGQGPSFKTRAPKWPFTECQNPLYSLAFGTFLPSGKRQFRRSIFGAQTQHDSSYVFNTRFFYSFTFFEHLKNMIFFILASFIDKH